MEGTFQNVVNFRDIAKVVNEFDGNSIMREGRFYRSARPDNASVEDRRKLLEDLKIKTIIDLRTKTELLERTAELKHGETVESIEIEGVNYEYLNLNGPHFIVKLTSRLSWYQFGQLAVLGLLGYRIDAAKIIGTNVIQPGGLIGLAIDTIDSCGEEINVFMKLLADVKNYPILIHCTQGKDRTGLLAILVLSLLGVPSDIIRHDYVLSQGGLDVERSTRVKELSRIGLGEEFADCDEKLPEAVRSHIIENFGSFDSYFENIGVDKDLQSQIKHIFSTGRI